MINHLSIYSIIILFLCGCANQKPPTGGEKDEDAPKLVSSKPSDQQVNYKGSEVSLTFNEAIKLNNPKEQLIITPRIDIKYEVKFKKEEVIIVFEEPLPDSTTFTFNFREAIQDLNEGNPAENLKLAFSTGNYLDSLTIRGMVKQLLSDKPQNDITVALYIPNDTLDLLTHKPYYFTKTNDKGHYQFDNIKVGKYLIAAVKDKNKNLTIDAGNEAYGFLPDTLNLTQSLDSINLVTQTLDVRPISIIAARQSGTTFDIKYNKFIRSYDLSTTDSITLLSKLNPTDQKSISIYNNEVFGDSLLTYVSATDTLYQTRQDTVYIKFEPTSRKPAKFEMNVQLNKIIPASGDLKGTVIFNKPIVNHNFDSIYIYLDSINILSLDSNHLKFSPRKNRLAISYTIDQKYFQKGESSDSTNTAEISKTKEISSDSTSTKLNESKDVQSKQKSAKKEQKPHLYFAANSFISVEQDSSTSKKAPLNFTQANNLATWLVQINPGEHQSYIVQLLDKNYNLVEERINESNIKFQYLQPGDYRIRVLIDSNENGHWDPGNILEMKLPEPIVFFINSEGQSLTSLRANWEVGPSIIEL